MADVVAFREAMNSMVSKMVRKRKCARKSRKSDVKKTLKDLGEKSRKARVHSENFELEQVLSELCDFSRVLQARLKAARGD
jgi:hypothetical protein